MPFPVLDTARLRLRPITSDDVEDVFALFGRDDVTRYWGFARLESESAAADLIESILSECRTGRLFEWGVVERSSTQDRLIGTCALCDVHPLHARADLGFAVHPDFQNRGYAGEAASAVVEYGFRQLDLHRLTADADPRNEPSLRLLRRLGFREEGHVREHYWQSDEWQDGILFGLLASEWAVPQD